MLAMSVVATSETTLLGYSEAKPPYWRIGILITSLALMPPCLRKRSGDFQPRRLVQHSGRTRQTGLLRNRDLKEKLCFKTEQFDFIRLFWYEKKHDDQLLCPKCFARNVCSSYERNVARERW